MSSQMCDKGGGIINIHLTRPFSNTKNDRRNAHPNGVNSDSQNEVRARLPKHEMKRFNGRPSELQAFIDCFDCGVHSNSKAQ